MREGCSSASHNPLPGSSVELQRDGAEMQVEIDAARSRSCRSAAISQAQETAEVVVPTPPRLPMNAMTWPSPSAVVPAAADVFSNTAASASRVDGLTR